VSSEKKVFIHPTAIVEEGTVIGEGIKIWYLILVRSGAKTGRNCNTGELIR